MYLQHKHKHRINIFVIEIIINILQYTHYLHCILDLACAQMFCAINYVNKFSALAGHVHQEINEGSSLFGGTIAS